MNLKMSLKSLTNDCNYYLRKNFISRSLNRLLQENFESINDLSMITDQPPLGINQTILILTFLSILNF